MKKKFFKREYVWKASNIDRKQDEKDNCCAKDDEGDDNHDYHSN